MWATGKRARKGTGPGDKEAESKTDNQLYTIRFFSPLSYGPKHLVNSFAAQKSERSLLCLKAPSVVPTSQTCSSDTDRPQIKEPFIFPPLQSQHFTSTAKRI